MPRTAAPLTVLALAATGLSAAPIPKSRIPTFGETNTNAMVQRHREKLAAETSSEWQGYPVTQVFDEKPETVWYSASGDAPMAGKTPTVTLTFPVDVSVKRVTVLGNRDPATKGGYFVLEGTVELLDKDGRVVSSHELKAAGDLYDFDLKLNRYTTARAVRFTATKDEKRFNCVAVSEIQVE
jgi:hypothetical protein